MTANGEPQAFLNGHFVPQSAAVVSVSDAGFVQGTTVAEQLRTFGGKLFRLDEHLARLERSLEIIGVRLDISLVELGEIARELARRNHALLEPGDDLNLAMFVTPGPYPAMAPPGERLPTVCLHTVPLPFYLWADKYGVGESLATTDIPQTAPECWPVELKCRSRMHYYLADQQARQRYPGARAVMLDAQGYVTEATTANLAIYRQGVGVLAPPREKVLPGISLAVLRELATRCSLTWNEQDLKPSDLASADEVWLASTSVCMLPVTSFNGRPIADGRPGTWFAELIGRWSDLAKLDVISQSRKFAIRG